MSTITIRVVTLDSMISGRWQRAFQKEGWLAVVTDSFRLGEEHKCGNHSGFDLIEIGLPDCKTPEELSSMLKARRPVSALVFGEPQKVSNSQIAAFLDAGADDFFYKNLDERILVAKLKAHIRRAILALNEAASRLESRNGRVKIDRSRRTVKIEAEPGKRVELQNLTQKEFDILSMLVEHETRIIDRETMLEKLWGDSAAEVYSECIDKHIESLRKKLGIYGKQIKTVYGSGYMFKGTSKL